MTDPVAIGARAPSMMGSTKASDEASASLFESILAARSVGRALPQAVVGPDVAGTSPEIWHGAEVVARPGLNAVGDAGEDGGRQVSAKVFNQNGFFGTSPSPWHDTAVSTRGEFAVDGPPAAEGAAAALALASLPPGSATAILHHPGSSAPAVRELRVQTFAAPGDACPQASGRQSAPVAIEAASSGAPTVEPGGEVVSPEMPERPILRCPTGFSPILVAVQELEHGLGVKAIIAGLDHGERLRLRDEIFALLSSHGHSVGAVAVGEGRPGFWKKVK